MSVYAALVFCLGWKDLVPAAIFLGGIYTFIYVTTPRLIQGNSTLSDVAHHPLPSAVGDNAGDVSNVSTSLDLSTVAMSEGMGTATDNQGLTRDVGRGIDHAVCNADARAKMRHGVEAAPTLESVVLPLTHLLWTSSTPFPPSIQARLPTRAPASTRLSHQICVQVFGRFLNQTAYRRGY